MKEPHFLDEGWDEFEIEEHGPCYVCPILAVIAVVIALVLGIGIAEAQEHVDTILVTGLDVSSSINAQETMLQVQGVADAIRSPAVVGAIEHGKTGRIGFQVFVWADGDFPELVAWRAIDGQESAEEAASELLMRLEALVASTQQNVGSLTNLSAALDHARDVLATAPFTADRAVVNIVGNGEDNVAETPNLARDALVRDGVTINGVVVGGDPAVMAYYRANVIGGKNRFVLPAGSAEDMAGAMIAKFVTEIAGGIGRTIYRTSG